MIMRAGSVAVGVLAAVCSTSMPAPSGSSSQVLAETEAPTQKRAEFKREWFYAEEDATWAKLKKMQGRVAAPVRTANWVGERQDLAKLKGKIVLIDFWATWCGPCIRAIPHTNEVMEKYKPKGVEVFGICCSRGSEDMRNVAMQQKMKYPTGADSGKQTEKAFGVSWWPFYVLVDRKGVIRAAGLKPDGLEPAIDALLEEQPAIAG